MDVANLLDSIGKDVALEAKRNLGTTRDRFSIRAKWKKGKPISYERRKKKGKSDNTSKLRNSITWTVKDGKLQWEMEGYGQFVEEGRKGKKLNRHLETKGGFIPVSELRKWMRQKPIRMQKEGGGFMKQDEKAVKALSYLINRKIKWFGIDATRFFSEAFYNKTKDFEMRIGGVLNGN